MSKVAQKSLVHRKKREINLKFNYIKGYKTTLEEFLSLRNDNDISKTKFKCNTYFSKLKK